MRPKQEKIKKLESLFQLSPEPQMSSRSLSTEQVSTLKPIMDFIKTEAPLPQSLIEWLANLGLLYGLPFRNLVADENLMSAKSSGQKGPANLIRFFYIDMKWIDSLLDGALSIGTHNSRDFKLQQAVHKAFRPHIENEMLDHRQRLKGKPLFERAFPEKMGTLSGFLLRSPLVLQWPGIEIRGFNKVVKMTDYGSKVQEIDDPDHIMEVLRMERLSPDTLLMIFKGVPKSIMIKEPSEGIYSGFKYVGAKKGKSSSEIKAWQGGHFPILTIKSALKYSLALRHLKGKNKIGVPMVDKDGTINHKLNPKKDFRDNGRKRVLNISNLKRSLLPKLKKVDPRIKSLTPKDFAVLMINSPRYYFYQNAINHET